jgi:hypothetical protein
MIVQWGPPTTMFVLLCLQIYTYHRTRHYGLAILVAASAAAFLYYGMGKLLSVEALSPRMASGILRAAVTIYAVYMVLSVWGAAALFRSYIQLTEANKVLSRPKAD